MHPSILMPSLAPSRIQLVQSHELSGDLETVAIEDVGDQRIYHYAQQTGHITNANEESRRENPDWDRNSDMRQVASVPLIVWNLWENSGITSDPKELRKALMRHKEEYMTVEKKLI
jgi:hypothetical protein